jgi:hypothetical protein
MALAIAGVRKPEEEVRAGKTYKGGPTRKLGKSEKCMQGISTIPASGFQPLGFTTWRKGVDGKNI